MNGMGEAIGAPLLMSPEEFRVSGLVDEVSNVYVMGAAAFMLLAGYDRSPKRWPLNAALYSVVHQATSKKRADRQQSIQEFINEWEAST
jgi:serine/threonine-protein kinase